MKEHHRPYIFAVTATTRPRRPQEQDGVDYFFLPEERFLQMLKEEQFLEWAKVYGHYYGVPKAQVREAIANGMVVVLKVDVQGAATIKKLAPEAVFIFLAPPDMQTLEQRLRQRMTHSDGDLALRLKTVAEEMRCLTWFDYVAVNRDGSLEETVATVEAIITAELCRVTPRKVHL
jgi:guanylate kinase